MRKMTNLLGITQIKPIKCSLYHFPQVFQAVVLLLHPVHPSMFRYHHFFLIRLLESVPLITGQEYTPDRPQSIAGHTHSHTQTEGVTAPRENTEWPESFDPRRYVISEGKNRVPSSGFGWTVRQFHFSDSWLTQFDLWCNWSTGNTPALTGGKGAITSYSVAGWVYSGLSCNPPPML